MRYFELSSTLKKNKVHLFSLKEVRNLFPDEKVKTLKNNLINWVSKGYFIRLKRDLYEFVEPYTEFKLPDLYVANRLYEPSYVSLETALSIYSIIPDIAAGVTSITIRPTRIFKNKYGAFIYRTCQPKAFRGYRLMLYEGSKILIADKEKAFVDFFYYRLREGKLLNFEEERFNKNILKKIDWKKALKYAQIFNQRTVNALKDCKRYVRC